MIYLDHNATTPIRTEVLDVMGELQRTLFGNASSYYGPAREARAVLEKSRAEIAGCIGANPGEIVCTSGGSESNNLAIRGAARALRGKGRHLITSSIEHPAVLKTCQDLERDGYRVTYLPVDSRGMVDPAEVERAITPETLLISIMHANNETGVIQPVSIIGSMAGKHGIVFHTDAVQTLGKIPVQVSEINADLISLSSHKVHGPKGIGVLYVRKGTPLHPLITGGSQERGLRAGTENFPAVAGFSAAVSLALNTMERDAARITGLRDRMETEIANRIRGVKINGAGSNRLPNTSNLCFKGVDGESILLHLDLKGICASSGSACSTGSESPSHVLLAMGLDPHQAQSTIRLSLGRETSEQDITATVDALTMIISRLRSISSL
ncbi:MAG TPA: cysteine desulfurase [Deltaproteobacteria bacterium]|nr:cysteine desulfurase [Deltaproteobacteria bacterium]